MCEIRPRWVMLGACNSVLCDMKFDLCDIIFRGKKPVKKETAHTTQNFHFMSSAAISVHCCLHRCSHLAFIPPSCICVRTLQISITARYDVVTYRCQWTGERSLRFTLRVRSEKLLSRQLALQFSHTSRHQFSTGHTSLRAGR